MRRPGSLVPRGGGKCTPAAAPLEPPAALVPALRRRGEPQNPIVLIRRTWLGSLKMSTIQPMRNTPIVSV